MNFWDNLVISSPPMLRRSTHHHCAFCGTNLEEYRQKKCRGCLLSLNEQDGMVVTGSEFHKRMTWIKRTRLGIHSFFLRLRAGFTRMEPSKVKRGRVYGSV